MSAAIESIWFGLGLILLPRLFYDLAFMVEPTIVEIYAFRLIGVMALAIGLGCWHARKGDRAIAKLMSRIMFVAKGGSTICLVGLMIGTSTTFIFLINPILTAFLFYINARLLMELMKR